jgi:hypothetical protein
MFVNELVDAVLKDETEVIKADDKSLEFFARGELYGHPDSFFPDFVEELILHVDLTFWHKNTPQSSS